MNESMGTFLLVIARTFVNENENFPPKTAKERSQNVTIEFGF